MLPPIYVFSKANATLGGEKCHVGSGCDDGRNQVTIPLELSLIIIMLHCVLYFYSYLPLCNIFNPSAPGPLLALDVICFSAGSTISLRPLSHHTLHQGQQHLQCPGTANV